MPRQLPASLSRKLLLVQGLVLVLIFAITGVVLDVMYRGIAATGVRERLELAASGVASVLQLDAGGRLDEGALVPVMNFSNERSGRYTMLRDVSGHVLWQSPCPEIFGFDVGAVPGVGSALFTDDVPRQAAGSHVGQVAVLSERLELARPGGGTGVIILTVAETRDLGIGRRAKFRRAMALWFSAATLAVLLALGALLHRVLGPLRRLADEIVEVESGKRAMVGDDYPREISGLARTLNALLRADQLRMARYRDTLGNLAHSLKTPLASMRAALAGQGPQVRAAVDHEIDRIAQLAEHQLRRAGTAGPVALGQKPIPVLPMVTELRTAMLRVHGSKDLSIEVSAEPSAGFLGDRSDLLELLGNVLDNACKWCRGRVQVNVAITTQQPEILRLQVSVADDGAGIDPGDRARVLARGVRADERAPGHGLGLAMVADTVALYGGDLCIDQSAALGGACITISLPGRLLDDPA